MSEKADSQSPQAVRWTDTDAVKPAALSDKAWLWLFVAVQGAMTLSVLLWPHRLWLPFLCDAVIAALTFFFALDHLRRATQQVRLIWTVLLSAVALLSLGHFLQFWVLLRAEQGLPPILLPANVSAQGLWYTLFVSARVPFLFLFAQIDEHDDRSYFRIIDALQSVVLFCLITIAYSPALLGVPALPPGQTVILLSLVYPLLAFFGGMNWLGRRPGYDRQLVGAITLYMLAKSVANLAANGMANASHIALGNSPLMQEARDAPVAALLFETLPHVILVLAVLHPFRPHPPHLSDSQRETIRFLNPVCFTVASLCLAFAVSRYNALLGGFFALVSVLLYLLRSAKWQSDFRRLKDQLAVSAQARANFLVDINHEIRSPLTSITLNVSRLNREGGLDADQTIMVKTIHKGADYVISTLNDILDMSRLETGALKIPLKPFAADLVIGEVVELFELQAQQADLVLDRRAATIPLLLGDAKRLRQVLTNILANAIRVAPRHSKIVIELEAVAGSGGQAGRITVTGFGRDFDQRISPGQKELLFPRLPPAGENGARGSGLGLAMSSALMKAMGGRLAFQSEPGQTRFWVELPQASEGQ